MKNRVSIFAVCGLLMIPACGKRSHRIGSGPPYPEGYSNVVHAIAVLESAANTRAPYERMRELTAQMDAAISLAPAVNRKGFKIGLKNVHGWLQFYGTLQDDRVKAINNGMPDPVSWQNKRGENFRYYLKETFDGIATGCDGLRTDLMLMKELPDYHPGG